MRTRSISKLEGAQDVAGAPDGHPGYDAESFIHRGKVWVWIEDVGLLMQTSAGIPAPFMRSPTKGEDRFLVQMRGLSWRFGLPVERGEQVKIGGLTISDPTLLEGVEKEHGPLVWNTWRQWFIGTNAAKENVVAWRMPEGSGLMAMEAVLVPYDGGWWAGDGHLFVRMNLPAKVIKEAEKQRNKLGGLIAGLTRAVEKGRDGRVVEATDTGDDDVAIGPSRVPRMQHGLAVAQVPKGDAMEWRWTAARDPVVGFLRGKPMAVIMPLDPEASAEKAAGSVS